ncbi:MAG: hypothetical protein Q9160_008725 [Pyrenula sp. 1 TL-2023]
MQAIKQIQALNKRELENAVPPSASWHADYRDTAYVYIGGLDLSLSEGDIITIFSQYGEPTHINLIRDKDTGKSKGYGFLKYEDQRSTDMAVDNLSGSVVVKGEMQLRVEHARYEKRKREGEDEEEMDNVRWDKVLGIDKAVNGKDETDDDSRSDREQKERKRRRPLLKDETDLDEKDAEDPMKHYFAEDTKADEARDERERSRRHQHRHRHRDGRNHRDDPRDKGSDRHGHHGNGGRDVSESRERRHRTDKRRRSRDRRRSKNRDGGSVSPTRYHHRHREERRHGSRDRDRRD